MFGDVRFICMGGTPQVTWNDDLEELLIMKAILYKSQADIFVPRGWKRLQSICSASWDTSCQQAAAFKTLFINLFLNCHLCLCYFNVCLLTCFCRFKQLVPFTSPQEPAFSTSASVPIGLSTFICYHPKIEFSGAKQKICSHLAQWNN